MTDLEAYREFMRNPSLDPQSTPVDLASAFSAGCQHARQQILDFTKPIPHQETATEVIAEARRERYDGVFAKPHRDTERLYWLANNQHQWGCITRRAKELAGPAWEALLMAIDEHMDPPAADDTSTDKARLDWLCDTASQSMLFSGREMARLLISRPIVYVQRRREIRSIIDARMKEKDARD